MDKISGQIVDVSSGRIISGHIIVNAGRVEAIHEDPAVTSGPFYSPGLIDSHIHVESSLLSPSEFSRAAAVHGTVATVSDPHEIANVCGIEGVDWMIRSAESSPVKISFGAPSCVPATPFETAGASFGPQEVASLLDRPEITYLSEVMNFPAVIGRDPTMIAIIREAKNRGLRIDGHAPGVRGDDIKAYSSAGIETDHECVTLEEARERIACGMKVAIREGSAARNFDALWPILKESPDQCFFCSDDRHPDDLIISHVDGMIRKAIANGVDPIEAIRVATINPALHYRLPVGLLRPGDPADFIEIDSLEDFRVRKTWIDGQIVASEGSSLFNPSPIEPVNRFHASPISTEALRLRAKREDLFATILAEDGQLVTGSENIRPTIENGEVIADPSRDLLKIVVVNRYQDTLPSVGLIRNFGLKTGAIAGSVAHDSHNIVAVGASDRAITDSINEVIASHGGLAFCSPTSKRVLPLPIAGLMAEKNAWDTATEFTTLTRLAHEDGCTLRSPFMTLSFMSLLVIPSLKIGDKGHFDVGTFSLIDPWKS